MRSTPSTSQSIAGSRNSQSRRRWAETTKETRSPRSDGPCVERLVLAGERVEPRQRSLGLGSILIEMGDPSRCDRKELLCAFGRASLGLADLF